MARSIHRGPVHAAVGVVALAVLSACGTQSAVSEPGQGGNAQESQTEPGDDIEPVELLARLAAPGMETLKSFDFKADLSIHDQEVTLDGAVDLNGDVPASTMTADVPLFGMVDVRLVDSMAYVDVPQLTPAGKFYEIPADELDDFGVKDIASEIDLEALMESWESSGSTITYVGEKEVRGQVTDHFEVVLESSEESDVEPIGAGTTEIWIGEDDLLRQMTFDLDGSTSTVLLDDWGQKLTVEAPNSSDIVAMPGT